MAELGDRKSGSQSSAMTFRKTASCRVMTAGIVHPERHEGFRLSKVHTLAYNKSRGMIRNHIETRIIEKIASGMITYRVGRLRPLDCDGDGRSVSKG